MRSDFGDKTMAYSYILNPILNKGGKTMAKRNPRGYPKRSSKRGRTWRKFFKAGMKKHGSAKKVAAEWRKRKRKPSYAKNVWFDDTPGHRKAALKGWRKKGRKKRKGYRRNVAFNLPARRRRTRRNPKALAAILPAPEQLMGALTTGAGFIGTGILGQVIGGIIPGIKMADRKSIGPHLINAGAAVGLSYATDMIFKDRRAANAVLIGGLVFTAINAAYPFIRDGAKAIGVVLPTSLIGVTGYLTAEELDAEEFGDEEFDAEELGLSDYLALPTGAEEMEDWEDMEEGVEGVDIPAAGAEEIEYA